MGKTLKIIFVVLLLSAIFYSNSSANNSDELKLGELAYYCSFNSKLKPGETAKFCVAGKNENWIAEYNNQQLISSKDGLKWELIMLNPGKGKFYQINKSPTLPNYDMFQFEAPSDPGIYQLKLVATFQGVTSELITTFQVLQTIENQACTIHDIALSAEQNSIKITWQPYESDDEFYYAIFLKTLSAIRPDEDKLKYLYPYLLYKKDYYSDKLNNERRILYLEAELTYYVQMAIYDKEKNSFDCYSEPLKAKTGQLKYFEEGPQKIEIFPVNYNQDILIRWDKYTGNNEFLGYALYIKKDEPFDYPDTFINIDPTFIPKYDKTKCPEYSTICWYLIENPSPGSRYYGFMTLYKNEVLTSGNSEKGFKFERGRSESRSSKYVSATIEDMDRGSVDYGFFSHTVKFPDVSRTHPNYNAIQYLKEHFIVSGYQDETFRPSSLINRAEILKIAYRTAETYNSIDMTKVDKNIFRDVGEDAWYKVYLYKALEQKVIKGYPDNTFRGHQPLNLAEALKILVIIFGMEQEIERSNPNEIWYFPYLKFAQEKKLISENNPEKQLTRGEAVELIYRFLNLRNYKLTEYADPNYYSIPIELFYYKESNYDGQTAEVFKDCDLCSIYGVQREINYSKNIIEEAIKKHIKGELTSNEKQAGISTQFPLGKFSLINAVLDQGTLTLTFDDPLGLSSGKGIDSTMLRYQVEKTAMQFDNVQQIIFKPDNIFQP